MFTKILLVAAFASAPLFTAGAPAAANATIPTCGSLTEPAVDAIARAAVAALNGLVTDTAALGSTTNSLVNDVVGIAGSTAGTVGTVGTVGNALGSIVGVTGQAQTTINNIVTSAITNVVDPALNDLSNIAAQLNDLLGNLVSGAVSGADQDKLFAAAQAFLVQLTSFLNWISKLVAYIQSASARAALKAALQSLQSNISTLLPTILGQCSASQKQIVQAATTKALTALSAVITKCG
ncbi:hypothetical protein C8R47DRAFT_1107070 [Mycena vitilis]|nr:hypothetical protein C8R47DRAFT_1107070 [Mycena vitilis]